MAEKYTHESLRAEAERRGVTVYQVRKERNMAKGLSLPAAVGHARSGEASARDVRLVQKYGLDLYTRRADAAEILERVAFLNTYRWVKDADGELPGGMHYRGPSPDEWRARISGIKDPETLYNWATESKEEFMGRSSTQAAGNPRFYHWLAR